MKCTNFSRILFLSYRFYSFIPNTCSSSTHKINIKGKCKLLNLSNYLKPYCSTCTEENCRNSVENDNNFTTFLRTLQNVTNVSDYSNFHNSGKYTFKLSKFSDIELVNLTQTLDKLKAKNVPKLIESEYFTKLVNSIDNECCHRARRWNLEKIIEILENTKIFQRAYKSQFLYYIIRRRHEGAICEPLPLLLRYIRVMNYNSFWRFQYINRYEMEYTLQTHLPNLNIEEVMLFVEASNMLKGALVNDSLKASLFGIFVDNLDNTDAYVVRKFLRFCIFQEINFSSPKNVVLIADKFLKKFIEKCDSFSIRELSYAAFLSTKLMIFYPELMNKMNFILLNSTFKDNEINAIECALFSIMFFNSHSNVEFYYKLLKSFEIEPRKSYLMKYPRRLARMLCYISCAGVYPYNLIDVVLSEKFLRATYGKKLNKYSIHRDIFVLDSGIRIECPDYDGNKLNSDVRENLNIFGYSMLMKRFHTYPHAALEIIPLEPVYNETLSDIQSVCNLIFGGAEYTRKCYLSHLPGKNLLFSVNSEKITQKLPQSIKECGLVDYKALNPDFNWYVVTVLYRNEVFKPDPVPMGVNATKVRQLQLLGFKVLCIVRDEWVIMSPEEKENYLKNKFLDYVT